MNRLTVPGPGRFSLIVIVALMLTSCSAVTHRGAVSPGVLPGGSPAVFQDTSGDRKTVWDGIYTHEQAMRGHDLYVQQCASCHLDDLRGDTCAPALIGDDFLWGVWKDKSVGLMYERIRLTMPQGNGMSMAARDYAAVVSYLLSENDLPSGQHELPTDVEMLNAIAIQEEKSN